MSSPSHGDGPAAEHLTVSTGSPHKTRSLADFLRRRKDAKSAKSEAVAVSPAAAKEAGQKDLQESPRSSAPGSPEESPSILSAVAPRVKKSSKFGSRKSSHHPAAAAVAAGPSARVAREELVLAPKPDAAATLEVTVVEARGVAAGLCFFRITVEGSTGSTASLEGPDAVFHVTETGNPNHNHFAMPVMDVAHAFVHVMLFDDAVDSNTLVACGAVPVASLLRAGTSLHEQTRWLALLDPSVVYFPTREDLAGLYQHLNPGPRRKVVAIGAANAEAELQVDPPKIYGYVQIRLHLRLANKQSSFRSLLFAPPIADVIPPEAQRQLESHDSVIEAVARASLLFNFVFSMSNAWRGIAIAALPFWYHLVFWAPMQEYPLLVLVLPTVALTIRRVVQGASRSLGHVVASAPLLSRADFVNRSEIGQRSEPMLRLFLLIARLLGSVLPIAERLRSAFFFSILDLSLIFVAGAMVVGLVLALLFYLFDDSWVVFCLGLSVLGPLAFRGLLESFLGRPVHVYELSFLQARNLAAFDVGGTSDPFCKVPDLLDVAGNKVKSPIVKKSLAPVWNTKFSVALSTQFHYNLEPLTVLLYDDDYGIATNLMGRMELQKNDFQFEASKWFKVIDGEGEVELGLRFLGNTYENYVTAQQPYWREWPMVKRLARLVPFSSRLSVFSNIVSKLPTYEQAARILFSQVSFFVDTHGVLPKAKFNKK